MRWIMFWSILLRRQWCLIRVSFLNRCTFFLREQKYHSSTCIAHPSATVHQPKLVAKKTRPSSIKNIFSACVRTSWVAKYCLSSSIDYFRQRQESSGFLVLFSGKKEQVISYLSQHDSRHQRKL